MSLFQTKIVPSTKETPTLADALNISAFNLANAGGYFFYYFIDLCKEAACRWN
ncbi:hypothetical protein ACFQ5E_04665 [Oceanobacillus sojae]